MGEEDIYIPGREKDEEGASMRKKKKFIWQTFIEHLFQC